MPRQRENELLIGFGATAEPCFANLSAMGDLAEAAANLFFVLHVLITRRKKRPKLGRHGDTNGRFGRSDK